MDLDKYAKLPTVTAIFDHYEKTRKNGNRPHLGGSQIGKDCDRAIWYSFRWAWAEPIEGRICRLFETGDLEETRLIKNLRDVGCTVWDRDPDTGRQVHFTAHGGHFGISLDGVIEGLRESAQPHVLEFKTMNDKNFKACSARGVELTQPVYWVQVQVGMHLSGLKRALFMAVNKNTDEIYGERIKYDEAVALKAMARAEAIIFSDTPPGKIGPDESFWGCKFCSFVNVCHRGQLPDVNCRTCAHSTAEQDGTWSCARHGETAPGQLGCDDHIWNNHIMPWEVSDAGDDWIEYTTEHGEVIRNHPGTSKELKARGV